LFDYAVTVQSFTPTLSGKFKFKLNAARCCPNPLVSRKGYVWLKSEKLLRGRAEQAERCGPRAWTNPAMVMH